MTLEENAVMGGAGSAVLEALAGAGISKPVITLGIPDQYIEQDSPAMQHALIGLDANSIIERVEQRIKTL